ncbi:hypothetical protein [Bradyrhizobium sp.]|uniref:hypothetical protein n=1 Tax=Bradyrhizobium sp. TaxID=376 RepID=UPI002605578B|nr:hypothetical protein [Bradyrhizobium sp.]
MTIIAALHDPLAIFVADNFSDVVTPHDDRTDVRTARVGAIMRPCTRQIVRRSGIAADLSAHVPSAPRARTAGMLKVPGILKSLGILKMPVDLAAMNVMIMTKMMVMMDIVVMVVMMATMRFRVRPQRT